MKSAEELNSSKVDFQESYLESSRQILTPRGIYSYSYNSWKLEDSTFCLGTMILQSLNIQLGIQVLSI